MREIYLMQIALYAEFYENEYGRKPRVLYVRRPVWECLGQPDIASGVRVVPADEMTDLVTAESGRKV